MDKKFMKLAKNTMILTVGSFGSKVLVFLIVPLYTHILSTSEYGVVDLFISTVNFLFPIITLLIQESIIRFVVSKEMGDQDVLSNSFLVFIFSVCMTMLLLPVYSYVLPFREYAVQFAVFCILGSFCRIFSEYLRASGKILSFTINGVINTLCFIGSNLVFLLIFKLGVKGYFMSLILSEIVSAVYISVSGRIWSNISVKSINKNELISMLRYSIPLIPNSIMWWIMNAGDKYIINYYLGDGANGVYSLAMKFPTILSTLFLIFSQAWQLSAIEVYKEKNETFYSTVYDMIFAFIVLSASGIIMFVKPIFEGVMGQSFVASWKYVPFLCVGTIFSCISSFCGVAYAVSKKTKMALYTTVVGAIVNLILNFFLINVIGLYGVAIGTAIGYLVVMIIRMGDARKEFGIKYNIIKQLAAISVLLLQGVVLFLFNNMLCVVLESIFLSILVCIFKDEFLIILRALKRKFFNTLG